MVEYVRPKLYPKQLAAMFCTERYGLIEASTKSGKTVSAMAWIVEQALMGLTGHNYWWISPGYNQSDIAFRRIKAGLPRGTYEAIATPVPKITLLNGAIIWFKTGDNADALYGEDVFAAVIDEASRVREDCWHAVRSTLTATNGPIRIIGNVKGRRNWFYELARRAESGTSSNMHYSKITAADAIAAGVTRAEEVEDARSVLPENIFRELYYAEPSDDLGNPFGLDHIRACIVDALAPGPTVAYGVDLAKSQDWFVIIGLNEAGAVSVFERWQHVPWSVSVTRCQNIIGEDTPALVDSTGLGDPVLEQLREEHPNFTGYHFTMTAKQKLMEGLAVSIQSHEITFPKGRIPYELEMFEYELRPSGVRYAAPEGTDQAGNPHHDDCVAALALARQCWAQTVPGENMMKFYEAQGQKQRAAQPAENDNNRPWQDHDELAVVIENELKELYEQSVKSTLGEAKPNLCAACGKEVAGYERVTDGEYIWHTACVNRRAA